MRKVIKKDLKLKCVKKVKAQLLSSRKMDARLKFCESLLAELASGAIPPRDIFSPGGESPGRGQAQHGARRI